MTSWWDGIMSADLLLLAAWLLCVLLSWMKSAAKSVPFNWVAVPIVGLLFWRNVPMKLAVAHVGAAMWVFTIVSVGLCLATIRWIWRLQEHRHWYAGLLVLSALFWWVGESLGLRLARYQYAAAPISIGFPGGGVPAFDEKAGAVATWIRRFFDLSDLEQVKHLPGCMQESWWIPVPLLMFEAVLLMSFVRLSELRLKCRPQPMEKRLPEALSTAGLCAFMLIVVFAILDPVVSTATWCSMEETPDYRHLNIGLWRWILTDTHPGYWFGIPLTNYITWLLTAAVFGFLARLDDYRPGGIIDHKKLWKRWHWAFPLFVVLLFAILIPVKALVDKVVVRGQDYLFVAQLFRERAWQFGAVIFLIWVAVRQMQKCHVSPEARPDKICVAPHVVVLILCIVAILAEAVTLKQVNWWVLVVWAMATAVTVGIFWPMRRSMVAMFWPVPRLPVVQTTSEPDRQSAGVA